MPFSWLYGKIADVRNSFFERGVFASYELGAPTISVGNLSVGGTGKTPVVAFVAETLADAGARVCILTRGYGRKNENDRVLASNFETVLSDAATAGDEPLELARKLLGKAIVVADADRVSAAKWALSEFKIDAFVLDDGFQHRRARRDLDIVLLDASDPFGGEQTLPFGRLRELPHNLARAGVVVITRADHKPKADKLKPRITELNSTAAIFTAQTSIESIVELGEFLKGSTSSPHCPELSRDRFHAFCALGNPENFFTMLRRADVTLAGATRFPDHYSYKQANIAAIENLTTENGAEFLLTTAKDAVKLDGLSFTRPCYVVLARPAFDDEEKLREMIRAVLVSK